jgi:hypothetical protein
VEPVKHWCCCMPAPWLLRAQHRSARRLRPKQGQSADLRLPQQRLSWAGTGGDGEIWTVVSRCSVPVSLVLALTRHLTIGKRHALLISDDVRRYQSSSVRSAIEVTIRFGR